MSTILCNARADRHIYINYGYIYNYRKKLWQCLQDSGFGGRILSFLQAAYRSLTCEVKVGEMMSDSFTVSRGLRQGCVLSPLLFSLYVNSLVEKLRGAGVGVECRGQMVTTLLICR